jgi:hypothetical protein
MRLLLIHGRAQEGKDPNTLLDVWIRSLQDGFSHAGLTWNSSLNLDFPFYGDKLAELSAQASLPTVEGIAERGLGQVNDYELFLGQTLDQFRKQAGISDDQVAQHCLNDDGVQSRGLQNREWMQAIITALDDVFPSVSGAFIEGFLRDVFLYVSRPGVQRAVDKIIKEKITPEPTVIVSHSLGTVVAYNLVQQMGNEMDIRGFVTVGSPLGIKAVNSYLGLLSNPFAPSVWFNAYDERDVVALNPLSGVFFPVRPEIPNYADVHNFTDNRHGIEGYLSDREVASRINSQLLGL